MELVLDTKNICFLCLKTISSQPVPDHPDQNEISLKAICRFLRINTSVVLLKGLKEGNRDVSTLPQGEKYNFSVKLCNDCYSLTEKLSSLILALEEKQAQVTQYSKLFGNILEKGDLTNPTADKDDTSSVVDGVIFHLRKTVQQKCAERNVKTPMTKLRRLKQTTGGATPEQSSKWNCVPRGVRTQRAMQKSSQKERLGPRSDTCAHCKRKCMRPDKFRIHMVRFHPDQIFLSYKPSHQPFNDFVKCCRQLLKRETQSRRKIYRSGVAKRCAYCPASHRYKIDSLVHLAYNHQDILGRKLAAMGNPRGGLKYTERATEIPAGKKVENNFKTGTSEEILGGDVKKEDMSCQNEYSNGNSPNHSPTFGDPLSLEEPNMSVDDKYTSYEANCKGFIDAAGPLE